NVTELRSLLDELREVNEAEVAEFADFEREQLAETESVVTDELAEVLTQLEQAREEVEKTDLGAAELTQAQVLVSQQAISERLEMVRASEEIQQAQEKARALQEEAREATVASKEAAEEQRKAKSPESQIAPTEERLRKIQETKERVSKELREALAKQEEVRTEVAAAKKEGKEKEIERQVRRQAYVDKAVEGREKSLQSQEAAEVKYTERLAELRKKEQEARAEEARQKALAEKSLAAAREKQREAVEAQKKMVESVQKEVAQRVAELQESLEDGETVSEVREEAVEATELGELDSAELYESAAELEKDLAESFRKGRAMRLAMLQNVPYQAALRAVDTVAPLREGVDKQAMTAGATTEAALARKKAAMREALGESQEMVAFGQSLLARALAGRSEGGGAGSLSLADLRLNSERMKELEKLADQETSGQAVDLTAAMAGAEGGAGEESGSAPEISPKSRPVLGRQVGVSGTPGAGTAWMSVDDWYVLGPFDNPGRANIDRVYPPESLVDLNAAYLGKDGRTIRWTFRKSEEGKGFVRPPTDEEYVIWYAFSEIQSAEEREVWLAMGSDDKGQVWLNGVPVWVSAKHHKNWRPDEALRRVTLQKGRNRILYRIENGWHGCAFSLWVNLEDLAGR
ncbi:MAG: hypothetical protein ACQKBY_08170, partial [Verrucomicrobiales bacterium]